MTPGTKTGGRHGGAGHCSTRPPCVTRSGPPSAVAGAPDRRRRQPRHQQHGHLLLRPHPGRPRTQYVHWGQATGPVLVGCVRIPNRARRGCRHIPWRDGCCAAAPDRAPSRGARCGGDHARVTGGGPRLPAAARDVSMRDSSGDSPLSRSSTPRPPMSGTRHPSPRAASGSTDEVTSWPTGRCSPTCARP